MITIYRHAIRFMGQSFWGLMLIAALLHGLALLGAVAGAGRGLLGAQLLLAHYMMRYFLFDAVGRPPPKGRVHIGLFLVLSGLMMATLYLLAQFLIVGAARNLWENGGLVIAYGTLGGTWLMAGVFGTLLPWSIARDDGYRLRAALTGAPLCLMWLILGPGLVWGLLPVIADEIWPMVRNHTALSHAFALAERFLSFFPLALAAATLCVAYRRALARAG